MIQYQGIFQRTEKKYLINESQFKQLIRLAGSKIIPDKFEKSSICNIYFDTPDHLLIRKSIEKPVYKEKLRLRSYGIPSVGSNVFTELKKKYKGIVYKRRTVMTYCDALNYLYSGKEVPESGQIINEINYFIEFYKTLIPSMFISYDRLAYICSESPLVRITFDSSITWREDDLLLDKGIWGNELLKHGHYIMEIKSPASFPLWLSQYLDILKIYPVSYSKYGEAYINSFKSKLINKRGGIHCA